MDDNSSLIRRVQLKQLEIIKVFQDICRRHGLRYFAIGGTCLGAIRHGGFIPWDDDIDVGMPYEDYAKFLALAKNELPENYAVLSYTSGKHFSMHHYIKLHDTRTTFIEDGTLQYFDRYSGVFVDVFPVHGLPENRTERKIVLLLSLIYRKLNTQLRYPFTYMESLKAKLLWLAFIPLRMFLPYYYFTSKNVKMMSKYPFGCSDAIVFMWRSSKTNKAGWYKNTFPYEYFSSTTELPFEDTTIAVPAKYDKYLTMEFGDYMKLPPEEQRINHSSSCGTIIDLDKPYTYYLEKAGAR